MTLSDQNLVVVGEDTVSVLLYVLGIAFPPAIPFIAAAKVALPLIEEAAPIILQAVENGESPFAAAEAASPSLGSQIKTIAQRIPVDIALSNSVSHLDSVTMLLVEGPPKNNGPIYHGGPHP